MGAGASTLNAEALAKATPDELKAAADALSAEDKAKVLAALQPPAPAEPPAPAAPTKEELTKLGLPEAQAEKSVKAIADGPKASAIPTSCHAVMKIKEGADVEAMTAALKAYSALSKKSPGKVSASYGISKGEIHFVEIFNGPGGMDAHIGYCFPEYVKMVPHADMAEIVVVCDPAEVEFWTTSASAWGATKFIVTAANEHTTPTLTPPTAEDLTKLGLPEAQAALSVKAIGEPMVTGKSTSIFVMMKVKEGADVEAMTTAFKAYGSASAASPGKSHAQHSIAKGEVLMIEVYDSPAAMDTHIGHCFPEYIKIVPHADMTEIICVCDPADVEFWEKSASAWGATKFIVTPSM